MSNCWEVQAGQVSLQLWLTVGHWPLATCGTAASSKQARLLSQWKGVGQFFHNSWWITALKQIPHKGRVLTRWGVSAFMRIAGHLSHKMPGSLARCPTVVNSSGGASDEMWSLIGGWLDTKCHWWVLCGNLKEPFVSKIQWCKKQDSFVCLFGWLLGQHCATALKQHQISWRAVCCKKH